MSRSLYPRLNQRYGHPIDVFTRREMLKATLAASAGLLLSRGLPAFAQDKPRAAGKSIVVIGAGFSGLACAHELLAAGYDVTVVEARNRIGGRVISFSDLVKGKNVEGGGELIGSNHPTWVSYADKFGLKFIDVTEDKEAEAPIVFDGKRLDAEEGGKLWEEMDAALAKMNDDARKIDPDEPWKADNAAALDQRTTKQWIDAQEGSALLKKGLWVQLAADNGQDPAKQSYLGNLTQVAGGGLEKYWTESEVYRCQGGNQQLAAKLAEAIGRDRLYTRLPVTRVDARRRGAVVVTCADGRTLECDDVVLATPPTTWGKIEIEPGLPRALNPQMGVNVKYLAAVKGRFWKEKKLAPDSLTDGPISMTWEGTDNQEGDEGATLNCFSGGPQAQKARDIPRERRDAAYAEELEKLYPGFKDQFVQSRFMDWPSDPWTLAGYSFPGPGQVTTVGPLMRKGVGNLHFAGEHTSYKFVGYMEGALNSGAALAKRLALRDGLLKEEKPALKRAASLVP